MKLILATELLKFTGTGLEPNEAKSCKNVCLVCKDFRLKICDLRSPYSLLCSDVYFPIAISPCSSIVLILDQL